MKWSCKVYGWRSDKLAANLTTAQLVTLKAEVEVSRVVDWAAKAQQVEFALILRRHNDAKAAREMDARADAHRAKIGGAA